MSRECLDHRGMAFTWAQWPVSNKAELRIVNVSGELGDGNPKIRPTASQATTMRHDSIASRRSNRESV